MRQALRAVAEKCVKAARRDAGERIGWFVVTRGRWPGALDRHRSPLIGTLVLFGVLSRATAGAALFWISLRHLPVLPHAARKRIRVLALDGVSYYNSARTAAEQGFSTISAYSASPAYVRLLAIVIRICGKAR